MKLLQKFNLIHSLFDKNEINSYKIYTRKSFFVHCTPKVSLVGVFLGVES